MTVIGQNTFNAYSEEKNSQESSRKFKNTERLF